MLAEKAPEPFDSERHIFEVKYDGARCMAYVDQGQIKLVGRSGSDYTSAFPELQCIHSLVHAREAVLGGELVVEKADGSHDFSALQSRTHRSRTLAVRVAAIAFPATYLVFDVLYVNSVDLTVEGKVLSLEQRKVILGKLVSPSDRMRAVQYVIALGIQHFKSCMRLGYEGSMAKERRGLYYPGQRRRAWLKVKGVQEDTFLICCGYTRGEGWREHTFGALVLGKREGEAILYCGSVGSGFTEADVDTIMARIRPYSTQHCPFSHPPDEPKLLSYVEPKFHVEVKFHEVTPDGKQRFPVLVRLRPDL